MALEAMADLYRTLPPDAAADWVKDKSRGAMQSQAMNQLLRLLDKHLELLIEIRKKKAA